MDPIPPLPAAGPAVRATEEAPARVLVVDDSASARVLVEGLLRDAGFETFTVAEGSRAQAAFEGFRPDLVILDVLMPDLDGLEVCRRLRATEQGQNLPILFLTADERPQTQAEAIEAGGDDLVYKPSLQGQLVIRVRSLLRIRKLQVALEQESASLRTLQASQEGLFRFIVHDLKSPLQGILSGAEMLATEPGLPPGTVRMAELIRQASLQMERMVQDILVVCRQGRLTPYPQVFDLAEALGEWTASLTASFTRRKAQLHIDVPQGLRLEADSELIRRCVLNLLDNALKYGPPGNEVCIRAYLTESDCILSITDQGPGIPAEMRERIFDPFARLDRDASQARVSSGLGLAFCREVALAHGGEIHVAGDEPKGATFVLTIPRKRD